MSDVTRLPIPDWGLRCPTCRAPLSGLRAHRCGRCHRRFDIRAVLAQHRPIPELGLKCLGCGYSLNRLSGSVCPECGQRFDLYSLLVAGNALSGLAYSFEHPPDHAVRRRPPRWTGAERPLPDFGLDCVRCGQPLAGAVVDCCRHCAAPFVLDTFFEPGEQVGLGHHVAAEILPYVTTILYEAGVPYRFPEHLPNIAGSPTELLRHVLVPREFIFDALYALAAEARVQRECPPAPGAAWACPRCGEVVPAGFEICWSCSAPFPPGQAAAAPPADEPEDWQPQRTAQYGSPELPPRTPREQVELLLRIAITIVPFLALAWIVQTEGRVTAWWMLALAFFAAVCIGTNFDAYRRKKWLARRSRARARNECPDCRMALGPPPDRRCPGCGECFD